MWEKLKQLARRYDEIGELLEVPEIYADPKKLRALTREQKALSPVVETYRAYQKCEDDIVQALALALQIAVHVHDEVGPLAGLLLYGESGELLQGVHDFAVTSDQMFDVGVVVGNDLHGRTVVAHAHFDIALVVDDVKQSFKVIGSDVSFVIELIDGFLSILRHGVLLL